MDWQEWLEKGKWGEGGWMEDGKEFRKDPKTGKKFEVKNPEKPKPTMFPRIIREFPDEKDEDPMVYNDNKKSWESWLEKEEKPKERDYLAEMQTQGEQNMYQNSSKKKKFLKEAKGAGKKIEQQMGENDLPLSYSNRLRTNIKRPAERVTSNDLSDLDGWVEETKSWESWLEKGRWDNPKHDTNTQKEYEAFEKLSKLPKNEVTELGDSIDEAIEGVKSGKLKKSWESWLEKNDPCWEGYEQYGMKDKNGKKVPNCVKKADESKPLNKPMRDDGNKKFKVFVRDPSTGNIVTVRFGDPNMEIKRDNPERRSSFRARHKCSEQKDITSAAYWSCKMWEKTSSVSDNVNKSNWEVWLEKNNAIETSHKEDEKKHEWDGKFSSSTIRDDVKDDDDKAVSEEESLEELTDGKLEEVEKLKSWELWLEKDALNPDSKDKPSLMNTQRFARISTEVRGGNAQGGKLGDASLRGMRAEEKKRGKKYKWKNPDRKGRGGEKKELYHGTERQAGNYPALGTDSGKESGEKFAKLFQEEKKSWELWLEKDSLDGKQSPDGLPKLTAGGKKVEIEAKNVIDRDDRGKKNEMYKSWLEKMQGAGDARFGNQHLTGLDQKPVDNEEDEANILPEKEQKTDNKEEKQEKTEDKEDKDNKPYKALSQE